MIKNPSIRMYDRKIKIYERSCMTLKKTTGGVLGGKRENGHDGRILYSYPIHHPAWQRPLIVGETVLLGMDAGINI